ncbi:equilibrative nucleoside transporter 1-like isoform X2 [Macrobrachium nipponense]|uniref:equilibrative nucleoside transporter 1-like isoform X2 n=1 Tax=Macrobrachium nipponense TaxID=159736 RepID=UPI0030C7C576
MDNQSKVPFPVLVVFYAIGLASLLPWNFFITADGYWQYKLRNVSLGDDWNVGKANYTTLQITFTSTMVIISNVFCTVFLVVSSAIVNRVSEWMRHAGSLAVSLAAMIVVTVMTFINTDSWQLGFYIVTMIIVALLNMAVAVVQASSYGLAGMFPESCMSGLVSGQAISGIFSSVAMIVSLLVGGNDVISALIFFLVADVTLVLTIAGYIYLTKTKYYAEVKSAVVKGEVDKKQSIGNDWESYRTVLKKVWLMGLTCGGTLLFTLMIYPAVLVYVTSTLPDSRWTEVFFQPTITFLVFNIGDWLGREAPRLVKWSPETPKRNEVSGSPYLSRLHSSVSKKPGPDGWGLHIVGATRVIFIPLLMLCHGDNKTFPTLFDNDGYYVALLFLFAFTNGYVMTLALIYYPGLVLEEETELAGTIMGAILGIEMVIGSLLSPAFVMLWGPTGTD